MKTTIPTPRNLPSGRRRRGPKVAILGLLVAAACAGAGPSLAAPSRGHDRQVRVKVDGRVRRATVHVPPGAANGAGRPVVLVFHGGFGTPAEVARHTGFDDLADTHGFLAVYPEGYRRSWADGRGTTPASIAGVDDVAFVRVLLDRLAVDERIDPNRVFATGISNGGHFAQTLACELSDRIAAIAPVAGSLPTNLAATCLPPQPVSVVAFHGTDDTFVPYEGGHVNGRGDGGDDLSAQASAAHWRAIDGTGPAAPPVVLPDVADDGTTVEVERAGPGRAGTDVVLYTIRGGGHTWPGRPQPIFDRAVVGRTTRDIDATNIIWEFFVAHGR